MNYRHVFHAGNFVDVMKHTVLALIIEHLKKKDKPFQVLDTHAGIGCYDLKSDEARRGGEAKDGIGRLYRAIDNNILPADRIDLLAPYLEAVAACNPDGQRRWYPGSARIARTLLRNGDRLLANELHPDDNAVLRQQFARDRQTAVLAQDAWTVLKSSLPPKERRGVILVDPPFEKPAEFERLTQGLSVATRRFATGIYVLWYPIKSKQAVANFIAAAMQLGLPRLATAEIYVRKPGPGKHTSNALYGSGLLIHNAPYGLLPTLNVLLPDLASLLAIDGAGSAKITELAGEEPVRSVVK